MADITLTPDSSQMHPIKIDVRASTLRAQARLREVRIFHFTGFDPRDAADRAEVERRIWRYIDPDFTVEWAPEETFSPRPFEFGDRVRFHNFEYVIVAIQMNITDGIQDIDHPYIYSLRDSRYNERQVWDQSQLAKVEHVCASCKEKA